MNRDDALYFITHHPEQYLKKDRKSEGKTGSKVGYICPACGSGTGANGTGMTSQDGVHFKCWACENFEHSDVLDIIGYEYNLTDFNEKLKKAAELYNITIDDSQPNKTKKSVKPKQTQSQSHTDRTVMTSTGKYLHSDDYSKTFTELQKHDDVNVSTDIQEEPVKQEADYSDFYLQANKNLEKTEYHRGISLETLNRFKVGFIQDWRHPNIPNAPTSSRLIIPTSKSTYIARRTDDETKILKVQKVGKVCLFNSEALQTAKLPIFIVESEIDALSIIDVGGEAVGLGGVGQVNALLETLKNERPSQPLILALDNDKGEDGKPNPNGAGQKATKKLAAGLRQLKINFIEADIYGDCKDANEALNTFDRADFRAAVDEMIERAAEAAQAAQEAAYQQLQKESVAYQLDSFVQDIEASRTANYYPTGFKGLDEILDGGLYAGLYIVGAISALGKTTFCLQIADNIAKQGHDVLIFSLEMARNELIAKSLSRLTYILANKRTGETSTAKTTRGILTGSRYILYSDEEKQLINDAVAEYKTAGANIYITEGIGEVNSAIIREKVENHISITGNPPVVLVDYLQIIAPFDPRSTDKQNTDKAVLELKRLSRDCNTPVIGISSFNRENYLAPVNLSSFKESGAIEYSSDVLIGLQYDKMDYTADDNTEKSRSSRIRELRAAAEEAGKTGGTQRIQVKVLKNRNGRRGDTVLEFVPRFNIFKECEDSEFSSDLSKLLDDIDES